MEKRLINNSFKILSILLGLILGIYLFSPSFASSEYSILKKIIINYNKNILEQSLADGSYMGEGDVLRTRPEVGEYLGMKVFIDQDYLHAKALFETAEDSLKKARELLLSIKKEKSTKEHAQMITELAIQYRSHSRIAQKKMIAYRSR